MDVPNGLIVLDSIFASHYGFKGEFFYEESYLWGISSIRQVKIPFLISNYPGKGHFSRAVKKMLFDNISVAIPTPLGLMQQILHGWGFIPTWDPIESIEYWVSPPNDIIGM